jgi:hypothetical protein
MPLERSAEFLPKAISAICLSMVAVAGCASVQATEKSVKASPSPSATATSATAARLSTALLPTPKGMRLAYGPETGDFGSLKSTKEGLAAVREAKLDRPECAGAAQLDAADPQIGSAPAAVVAFDSDRGSITQALVSLPAASFPAPLPKQCASYGATVHGTRVVYRTKELTMPKRGDESRAYLTTASGGDRAAEVGSVTIRRGNVVMSMLVVGRKVRSDGLFELSRLADQNLTRITS